LKYLESNYQQFLNGTAFGIDLGTASIGYAVRNKRNFPQVGALLCSEAINDLSKRRELRRQRRTLRNRNHRRKWFSQELSQILALPRSAILPDDPITLRCRALRGEQVTSVEIFTALVHLFKRRGYAEVPWANGEPRKADTDKKKEEGFIRGSISELEREMETTHCTYPCQLLLQRRQAVGRSPQEHWARKLYWPRDLLEKEFRAILEAQKSRYPLLHEKADWLLFGDTKEYKKGSDIFHVFHKATEGRNPGILGLRWPRFDNRSPGLDALRPFDEEGRPQHVVRRNKDAFKNAQWQVALHNFRVVDIATGAKIRPDGASLARLKQLYDLKKKPASVKIPVKLLTAWEKEFASRYKLIEGQTDLTPGGSGGRARFSSPTLLALGQDGTPINAQPILRRAGESKEAALDRYLREIRHPLVRHRLILFRQFLVKLIEKHGQPDFIIVEAARSLADSKEQRLARVKRNREFQQDREDAVDKLTNFEHSTSRKAILRYRLWKEIGSTCPFCLEKNIEVSNLFSTADIEHLVPQSRVDCNEFYNLTLAHTKCNRELKGNKTPYEAFHDKPNWPAIQDNARLYFKGRKLELFLSPEAETKIEEKADLQHTAYIARAARHVALIQLGWLGEDGRDPTPEKQNPALRFQVTTGQLTHRLRQAWGLNQILHPLPTREAWDAATPEQQQKWKDEAAQKNRGDLRHHALDAAVIASTLPWLAHRTHGAVDENGNHGWWTQDEKMRSKAANPVGLDFLSVKRLMEVADIKQHVSRSQHQQAYNTTLYAKKGQDCFVAREVFTSLTPKNLEDIYPETFKEYCRAAWNRYVEEAANLEGELKASKKCLPSAFTEKLCFSHFQKWRANDTPEFTWPRGIKIPIRNVRLISVKDDKAVMPASPGTHGYVKRTSFREVRIHRSADGKAFVPVFVPFWRKDQPFFDYEGDLNPTPLAVVHRGMIVQTVKPFSNGQPAGKYRILVTGQAQLRLIPHHLADTEEACLAAGLPKKGLQPYWPDFIRVLGYELPHPPSAQPKSPDSGQA
jgi:hypothetical protein